jgi:hypothetical protein
MSESSESCKNCGNKECAADKCSLASIRIMLECGKAEQELRRIVPTDRFQRLMNRLKEASE